MTASFSGLST